MDVVEKTDKLRRETLPIDALVPQDINPNKMSAKEFNLLCDNIQAVGFVDPVFVRPIDGGKYRIIGGYHRWRAAETLGMTRVPVTVIEDPNFDKDHESFQIVRMNMIRGKLDTEKFLKLYDSIAVKYETDLMAEAFGFSEEAEFKKLITQMSKSLPKELQAEFKEAAQEIKTIDGLTKLLNQMFTKHGDSLPYGYMVVDFGGAESVWLRLSSADKARFMAVADMCKAQNRGVDSLMRLVLQLIAGGQMPQVFETLKSFPEVKTADAIPLEG